MVCVYMSNTAMFIGSMLSIYYINHNYMFRPLILAIIRLYMNTYQLVIQTYVGCFSGGGRGLCRCEISFFNEGCVVKDK
jgi:hypothetical protein